MDEENKVLTADEVREVAMMKLQDSLYGYSINMENNEKTAVAEGLAALYREVMQDDLNRKKSKWEAVVEFLKATGAAATAIATFWAFGRATRKEDGEIFDTLTKQTVVRNFLGNLFRKN